MIFKEDDDFATWTLPGVTGLHAACPVPEIAPASLAVDCDRIVNAAQCAMEVVKNPVASCVAWSALNSPMPLDGQDKCLFTPILSSGRQSFQLAGLRSGLSPPTQDVQRPLKPKFCRFLISSGVCGAPSSGAPLRSSKLD